MLTIYHAPRSRSVRVVWLCEEMGVPYETIAIKLGEKPPELLAHNPGATIPVMMDGDLVLFESVTMLEYVADRYGPTDLVLPPHHPNYWDYRQMLLFGEATLAAPINAIVGTLFRGPEDQQKNFTVDLIRGSFKKRTGVVAQRLERGPYMAGETFTLADISVVYGLGLALKIEALGMQDLISEPVADYVKRTFERPAWRRTLEVV